MRRLLEFISRPQKPSPARSSVKVGWFFDDDKGTVLLYEPERVRSADIDSRHPKSASRCPAVISLESRYFMIRCPYDMHLRFARDENGRPLVRNMLGDASPVRQKHLGSLVNVTSEREWRYKDRPTLQITLPYVFVADDPVYVSQLPPFFHHLEEPWPGTLFGGRFPIHMWARPLMWAFEWHDIKKDLILRRGDPWFYVYFETTQPDRPVALVQAERTPELLEHVKSLSGVVNYANQTFSLFEAARKRRPENLLVERKRTRPSE